jgi:hypothetical protein
MVVPVKKNTMKKIFLTFAIIFLGRIGVVQAQVTLSVNITYPVPSYLSDWSSTRAGVAVVTFTPTGVPTQMIKFETRILTLDGTVIAASNKANAVVYTLQRGPNTFTLDKLLQLENLRFNDGKVIRSIQNSGKLPPGSYQLCVQILNSLGEAVFMKSPVCRPFTQETYQLPYLLSPENKVWLDATIAQTVINFRWSSIVPRPKERVIYRLQVFEVMDNQLPVQALRANQPILSVEVANTQYFWRPQLDMKEPAGRVFIWTVQTLDARGYPIETPDPNIQGRSEPRVFGVCHTLQPGKENPAEDCANSRKL